MKKIVILGAGRSATVLIGDLRAHAHEEGYSLVVADADFSLAERKCGGHPLCSPLGLNAQDETAIAKAISGADIVISLLPPKMHYTVAKICIEQTCPMLTASYVDSQMFSLSESFNDRGIFMLGEMGLDPGIDHMSSMVLFSKIKGKGGRITAYRSSTGGLVAPESDDNPWHYKFSWNPRNVVTAGAGTAQYQLDGSIRYVPYLRIFETLKKDNVAGLGVLDSYPNRNSLPYAGYYGLEDLDTIYRGTYRMPGFCTAWQALIQIGYTTDQFYMEDLSKLTYAELTRRLLGTDRKGLDEKLASICSADYQVIRNLQWLGLLSEDPIRISAGTPADVLENLLLEKWAMQPGDKDMIVMQHEVDYALGDTSFKIISSLIEMGVDEVHTAMAKLVGLPMAIFARHYLKNDSSLRGVHIPVLPEIYLPVLKGLESYESRFSEEEFQVS
jgi:saccharopine dehydrogenase-like NADP-dependent oxidoreductase